MTECAGLFYKCEHTQYQTKAGWEERTRMRLLRRISCPGCKDCDGLLFDVGECCPDRLVQIKPHVVDGGIYRLKVINLWVDHETGYCDDWDTAFVLEEKT